MAVPGVCIGRGPGVRRAHAPGQRQAICAWYDDWPRSSIAAASTRQEMTAHLRTSARSGIRLANPIAIGGRSTTLRGKTSNGYSSGQAKALALITQNSSVSAAATETVFIAALSRERLQARRGAKIKSAAIRKSSEAIAIGRMAAGSQFWTQGSAAMVRANVSIEMAAIGIATNSVQCHWRGATLARCAT